MFGILYGAQSGRQVDVLHACETVAEAGVLDSSFFTAKHEQCAAPAHAMRLTSAVKQVFKDLDVLGWYTTGSQPTPQHLQFHKQVALFTPARRSCG